MSSVEQARESQRQGISFSPTQMEFMNFTGKQAMLYGGFGGGKT